MLRLTIIYLLIIVCAEDVTCKKLRQENSALEPNENPSGKRTLMISNLMLLPILAGVGIKFLVVLPIILSKIALLGILSFVSSNLSLLVSAVMGVRSYFFDEKPIEEDYDYDGHYKSRHDPHKQYKYDGHKDPHDDDPYDKYMHRYKGYELAHPEYHPYYPDHRYHDGRKRFKKQFRPFKLFDRIKDAIKDHFYKSGGHGDRYREYNDHIHNSHDWSDDHNEYSHDIHETRYKNSDYMTKNHQSSSNGKYYEGYKIPQDWSQKDEVINNYALKSAKLQDLAIRATAGSPDDQLKISPKDNAGELMRDDPDLAKA